MSARTTGRPKGRKKRRSVAPAREDDPRVVRSRAAVVEAARSLFLEKGYGGTSLEEIAALAGLTKRTVYNNYADKAALFTRFVSEVIAFAEEFARGLSAEFADDVAKADLPMALHDLGRRLALGILRPEVIALRRLLIREAPAFPDLAQEYFDRAPGRVIGALATGFEAMGEAGLLRAPDPRRAAEQFAYLVAGAPLDHATLVGATPSREAVIAGARDGVETFLACYLR
jgi:TetR/AcrR family transcriptional repressor of mexJK operon